MMMIGEGIRRNTTVDVPPWLPFDDQKAGIGPPIPVSDVGCGTAGEYLFSEAAVTALQGYLPSNEAADEEAEVDEAAGLLDPPVDIYSCDEFRMYEFKVRRCAKGRSHDWTECPYAHPGEKARRRDPRKYNYSGAACPDFRKGSCKRGDACEFAHGVFECWLHPARYRTQPCKDGIACRRRVCFFAHTPEQLRVLSQQQQQQSPRALDSYDGSPLRHHAQLDAFFLKGLNSSSPTSTLISPPSPPTESAPLSPMNEVLASFPLGSPVNDVLASLRKMQLSKVKSMPSSWGGVQVGGGLASPRVGVGFTPGFCSLPSTPKRAPGSRGWLDSDGVTESKPVPVEIVESGRALRALMYEKLSKDNWLDRSDSGPASSASPDLGWVSELVK